MKKIYLLILSCFLYFISFSQKNGSVKGIAFDTLSKQPVSAATITLLRKKDSSLVGFTMTDARGQFELAGLSNGEYRLLATHVSYHNTALFFTINDAHKQVNMGNLVMNDKSRLLSEVVVTAEAPPVTLIDDTVQYNAGSFKTAPNSTVEQLLKKMPGIKVEKDGTVKAQGQDVKKVLVDGKEFFGTDPKIATRNLPADAVDKVQVYDKMSDQSQLTGFDDGNSEKTINLKLKKDKKKGLFGKAMAGGGTNDRYEGRFNVNSFKGARQMSVIGMANNTNAEGFNFMDMLNFTGALNKMRQDGGGIDINIGNPNSDASGATGSNNTGIRTIFGGGINYNNMIGNKTNFTSNYFYNGYNPNIESHTQRTYFLPDSSYLYNQDAFTKSINNSQKLNLSADIQLDSFNSIKITPSFGYQQTHSTTSSDYYTFSPDYKQGTSGSSYNETNNHGYNFSDEILFRRRFRQRGRTFSFDLQNKSNASDGDGSLQSSNTFRNPSGAVLGTQSINQRNTNSSDLNSYTARAVYTEPIFKRSLLEFSLGKSNSKSSAKKATNDYNALTDKYDQFNDQLSNDFESSYGYNNAGIRWRMQQKKLSVSVGGSWQQAKLDGRIISNIKDSAINKTFYNLLPNARVQYNFSKFRFLRLNYNTNTSQPSLSQLQPVPDISDPLNIKVGNPDLKQELTHGVQLNFFSLNPFKNKNLFAFFNLTRTDNKIVDYDVIDSIGIKTTHPVNTNGTYNLFGSVSVGLPIRFWKSDINFSTNATYTKNKSFINGAANMINTLNLGPEVRLVMSPTAKLDVTLTGSINYYKTQYSLKPDLNTEYINQQYGTEINWELPHSFFFNTEFTYTINNQLGNGFNARVPLWNAYISRQFLKFNKGEIKLSAYDMLNQNVGVSRSTSQNYIEDKRVVNLRRFFMLNFTYSLNKNGLGRGGGMEGIRILRK